MFKTFGDGAHDGLQEGQDIGEFDRMCEVQSDKASVEITSRYTGTVAKLHAAPGDIVQVLWILPSMKHFISNTSHVLEHTSPCQRSVTETIVTSVENVCSTM